MIIHIFGIRGGDTGTLDLNTETRNQMPNTGTGLRTNNSGENAMRHSFMLGATLISSLLLIGERAGATQPPDVVNSDSKSNTAMGTGALFSETTGYYNTASGFDALHDNTAGYENAAFGYGALAHNTTGVYNTAVGAYTLSSYTPGNNNTASGYNALNFNNGDDNTASGANALYSNTTGNYNTASGANALLSNTTGIDNTAAGYGALYVNTTGENNTASGFDALFYNTTGYHNTATGARALESNRTGSGNTALGGTALFSNSTGNDNSAFGTGALYSNTSGSNNIAIGINAGYNLTNGSHNIDIGNQGIPGDGSTIRIGAPSTQSATFIAGIDTAHVTGAAVYVTSSGQLGVLASSERYKTAIAPMGSTSEKLERLRPVTFHLKTDPAGTLQYGLIAEEVDKVYPDLVIRNAAGTIQGVRYDELAPLLLNEVQQQQHEMRCEAGKIDLQAAEIQGLKQQQRDTQRALAQLQDTNKAMQAVLQQLQTKDGRVAMR